MYVGVVNGFEANPVHLTLHHQVYSPTPGVVDLDVASVRGRPTSSIGKRLSLPALFDSILRPMSHVNKN